MKYGKDNSNYKHGKYIENRCKKCDKLIDPRSTYCHKCRPDRGKKSHTEETKKIIGEKSKAKFTSDYLEKIKNKHRGKKKRSSSGYILIKDYEHPNRNSHNDVLEHVYVMSKHLNRPINKNEIIHHIDGDRTNNILSNLYLYKNKSEHKLGHSSFTNLLKEFIKREILIFENGKYRLKE